MERVSRPNSPVVFRNACDLTVICEKLVQSIRNAKKLLVTRELGMLGSREDDCVRLPFSRERPQLVINVGTQRDDCYTTVAVSRFMP